MSAFFSFIYNEISGLFKNNSPFAVYRLPETNEIFLLVANNVRTLKSLDGIDHLNGFVIAPFDINGDKYKIMFLEAEFVKSFVVNMDSCDLPMGSADFPNELDSDCGSKEAYAEMFSVFKKAVKTDSFQKLVLARRRSFEKPEKERLIQLFFRALKFYGSSFVYMCYIPAIGVWLGATPELLLEENCCKCKTVALAGTQSLSEWEESYKWSNKNIEEQAYVADYICSVIENFAIKREQYDTETVVAGNVVHLKTLFSFDISDRLQLGNIISALHPTPAMCGLPKKAAMDFIINNENFDREYYSGFVGPVFTDRGINIFVNIRCMHIDGNVMNIYAGGGILPESELESEYEETEKKMKTLLDIY